MWENPLEGGKWQRDPASLRRKHFRGVSCFPYFACVRNPDFGMVKQRKTHKWKGLLRRLRLCKWGWTPTQDASCNRALEMKAYLPANWPWVLNPSGVDNNNYGLWDVSLSCITSVCVNLYQPITQTQVIQLKVTSHKPGLQNSLISRLMVQSNHPLNKEPVDCQVGANPKPVVTCYQLHVPAFCTLVSYLHSPKTELFYTLLPAIKSHTSVNATNTNS